MVEKYPVKYYYKNPVCGTEMSFSQSEWGWGVGFPQLSIMKAIDYDGEIPWPKLSKEDQEKVDTNYAKLYKAIEEDEDD